MYFGSVKFFKHLILTVTALLIIIPCVICVVLAVRLNEKNEENEKLKKQQFVVSDEGVYTPEQMLTLYKNQLDDKNTYLKLIYDYDDEIYKAAAGLSDSQQTAAYGVIEARPAVTTSSLREITDDEPEDEDADEGSDLTIDTRVIHSYEQLYPDLYAEGTKDIVYDLDMDCVYLTFDDGPSKYTENILYYLDLYGIKATFFVVPDGSAESNARLKKIADAGHTIGVHTATHEYNKIYASVEAYLEDFKLAYDRIYEATGIKCTLFRFPGGSINDYNGSVRDELITEMTRRGFVYFDWNVDSRDALGATWTEMYNTVLSETANAERAVILMHDYNGGYNTVLVLEDIIKALIGSKRGYKLLPLTNNVKPVQF